MRTRSQLLREAGVAKATSALIVESGVAIVGADFDRNDFLELVRLVRLGEVRAISVPDLGATARAEDLMLVLAYGKEQEVGFAQQIEEMAESLKPQMIDRTCLVKRREQIIKEQPWKRRRKEKW